MVAWKTPSREGGEPRRRRVGRIGGGFGEDERNGEERKGERLKGKGGGEMVFVSLRGCVW